MFEFQHVFFSLLKISILKSVWKEISVNYCAVQAVTGVVTLSTYNRWNLYPPQTRDIAPRQLYWYSNISRFVLCSQISIQHIIKKTEHFPFKCDRITLVGEVWCFFSVPTQILLLNVLHSCWQFHIVVSHCHRSYSQK